LGLHLAALRETFEESGVLLAVGGDGGPVMNLGGDVSDRLAECRVAVHNRTLTLLNLIRTEGWFLALDALAPYARWITPEAEPRRFDTRFFLARLPQGAQAVHDRVELTESVWLAPADALARHRQGDLPLLPPTFRTLEELAGHQNVEGLWAWVREREIRPIMPEVFMDGPRLGLRLPGHPDYSPAGFRRPAAAEEPIQILLDGSVWRSVWS
jgi:8-oxo-dGTP pyrophosphatase MutT (NUDIX family)